MDAELLRDIALARGKHADPTARRAFAEFYERHVAWLYDRVGRTTAVRLLPSEDAIQDVVQETFYRAYVGARTFNRHLAADPQRLIALVRGWLGGIANHVIADMLRRPGPKAAGSQGLNFQEPVHVPPRTEPVAVPPVVRALQEELQKLSPLQRDILTAAELYYQPDAARQRLPNGVVKMLARQHGTSSANIRQVRRRTFAGLRKKLWHLIEENE